MSRRFATLLTAGIAAAALGGAALAAAPSRPARADLRAPAGNEPSEAIQAVVVTDQDPSSVFQPGRRFVLRPLSTGPFDAHRTLNLFIITVFDRRQMPEGNYDQVTRLILPDGSLYEERTTPVNPGAVPGQTITRPDLGPRPAKVKSTPRMRRLARMLPAGTLSRAAARNATYTSEILPVSGTWITKHNLYGTWKVEVALVRDGVTVSTGSTTFELGIGAR
ncbi:MAG: hypothetical protein D6718_06645 [Acidobacteria bacterium]|nr:MAG: hypothetical protein D6718_06645 [Acidobacteriota bacterium]